MKSKKLQKYQNSGSTGYSWSQGQTKGKEIVPASKSVSATTQSKETQKDINKRQEQINKLANDVLKSKSLEDLTDEDYSIIEQSTIPKKDNIIRDYRILKANRAQQQDNAWTSEGIANSTAALGDKLSLQRLPGIGQYIPDVLDVTKGLGDMAAGLGAIPDNLNKGDYSQAALNIGLPLLTGALAGLGTTTRGQFLNNLVNPMVGTGDILNNLGNKYLPNAYKLNPLAFKTNPNNFYRQIDNETFQEGLESGLIRGKQNIDMTRGENIININKSFGDDAYYNKGRLYYKNNKDLPYLFEANLPEEKFIPKVNGRTRKYTTENTSVRVSKKPLPINDPNITTYKKDWLKGYKPIEIPKSNFKSEINWRQWNKEIPDNPQLMQEYNTIEQKAKANNTWMKNPDGSKFQGTPEQFVQQNSQNFKKAFGNSKLVNPDGSPTIQYHGSAKKFDTFDESKFQLGDSGYSGRGIYTTPDKNKASSYSLSSKSIHKDGNHEPTVYELYGQGNNPISAEDLINQKKEYDLFNFHRQKNWRGDVPLEEQMLDYDVAIRNQTRGIERVSPWNQANELVFPTNKQLKSAIGNNGMFDMNNPNIYKSLLPIILGAAGLSQQNEEQDTQKYQSGGAIMKTQKKKGLQKYQDSGYTKAPYNDPFASIFSNALGSGLYAYTNNNPFLNTHDSILGQPLSASVGEQGAFLGSLPMFQQLNKPLGSWDQESKGIENSLFEADGKKYGTAGSWKKTAEAWAKETGQDPRGYEKYVQDRAGQNYDSTVAAQKQWNEFGKPLAANMFAIDELNKLTEKSYNQGLKLDAQDLTKGAKGQEFRGFFAKDGMRVGNFQSGGLTHRDSIEHQVDKIIKYEVLQGGPNGLALDGTNNMPDYRDPKYKKMLMDNIYTEVSKIMPNASAIEKAEAMDLVFNSGYNKQSGKIEKDPRGYALQEYYKKYDRSKLDKDGKWAGRKNAAYSFDEEYNNTIGRLPENERRVLMNLGRDWYYKNTNNPAPGVLSPDYNTTWYGRIHNTNDFKEFDPKNPKFRPSKKQDGGTAEYPFLDFLSSSQDDDKIKSSIKRNEGSVIDSNGNHIMYPDSEGYSTVGYGHLMRGVESPILSQKSADQYFDRDYELHKKHAEKIPGFSRLDSDQKAALIDMTFNMGPEWYKKFPKFTKALEAGDLDRATSELRDSLWAKQVGPRAERNIKMIGGNRMSSITNREQGGSISALYRSMGADVGLPTQKKESGGQINQLQQILGYKDGSPFVNLPFQTINSNSITMDGVSQPLLAIADNGERRVMQPNSGLHNFQGANSVMEIPMAQNGMTVTSNNPVLNSNILPEVTIKGKGRQPIYVENGDPRIKKYQDSLYAYNLTKSIPDFFTKQALEIDDAIRMNVSDPSSVMLKNGKREDFYKVMLPISQAQLRETEKKMGPINDFIERTKILPSQDKKVKQWDGYITPDDGSKITGKVRGLTDGYVKVFKKPVQPYVREKRNEVIIDNLPLQQLQEFSLPQRYVESPEIEDPNFTSGEMIKPLDGVPNLNVVFKERRSDGQLIPVFVENQAGERVPYNSQLQRDFQYRKKEQGGRITSPINLSKNINPFRLSPINSFGLGGFIRDGVPSRSKSEVGFSRQPISGATTKGPMGPKATDIPSYNGGVRKLMDMPENEYIPTENLIPIQTEKGEMIVMPTGDLVKVMATKRHHQMDEDEVTDVAPEGAYILSSFGKVRINRDEAEQVITETGVKPYRIGSSQDSPTEKNLASMMTKKSMSPADIAKRVDRFFPVNSTSNPFELAANNENKTHRVPYLEGLIQLSELDKLRKGIDSGMESQQQENEDEMTEAFKNGGSTWGGVPMRNMLIPKFQSSGGVPPVDPWSAVIQAGTGLIQTGAGLWNSYQQRKAQKEFVKKGTFLSDTAYGKARNEMGMGYLAGMLGVMNQDPTVTAKYNDPTYLRQMQTRTPMSTLEAISNRSYANMPNYMQNAPTWQAGLGAQQAAYAAALKAANDARLTIGEQDRNAQNDWLKLMQTNLELNNNNRVEAVNATRLNRNQQVGAVGNQTQGYMDSLANATLGQLSNQLSLEGVRANANVNFSNNIANSLKGGINTIGTAGLSYLDSRNRTTTNNPNAGYGSGVGPGYGGTGPSTPGFTCFGGTQYAINLDGSLVPTGKGC